MVLLTDPQAATVEMLQTAGKTPAGRELPEAPWPSQKQRLSALFWAPNASCNAYLWGFKANPLICEILKAINNSYVPSGFGIHWEMTHRSREMEIKYQLYNWTGWSGGCSLGEPPWTELPTHPPPPSWMWPAQPSGLPAAGVEEPAISLNLSHG